MGFKISIFELNSNLGSIKRCPSRRLWQSMTESLKGEYKFSEIFKYYENIS